MGDFTVRVELKGLSSEGNEYLKLHGLMDDEGFLRNIWPPEPSGVASPEGPVTRGLREKCAAARRISCALPHATYFGQSGREASPLLDHLVDRIANEIHSEVVVFIAETKSYAIHPG